MMFFISFFTITLYENSVFINQAGKKMKIIYSYCYYNRLNFGGKANVILDAPIGDF